jgi:glycerophosphoryl diester phosphodiesterase
LRYIVVRGAGVIEFDVGLTRDNGFAILHDETLERETTGSGPLRGVTLAQFKELRLRGSEEPTITLIEMVENLRRVERPLKVQVDFKEIFPIGPDLAAGFIRALAPLRNNPRLEVVVGCMADWNLRALRRVDPALAVGVDFGLYLDAPTDTAGSVPMRVNAYGYLDDHPLGWRKLLSTRAYLEDRVESLLSLLPDAREVYLHKEFVVQAQADGFNPIEFVHRMRHGILVDAWTINAEDSDFKSSLRTALELGADQITTDTAVALAGEASSF